MSFTSGAGFVGANVWGEIINCYSTGTVTPIDGADYGGFCAGDWGTITDCFWDEEASGIGDDDGGAEGKTTIEMTTWYTFERTWCDMVVGSVHIWNINLLCNDSYPCLVNVTPSCDSGGGGGTAYGEELSFETTDSVAPYKIMVAGIPVPITRLTLKPGWD